MQPQRENPIIRGTLIMLYATFFFCLGAYPANAGDPVEVVVTGAEGETLENVKAALALPPGLVNNGEVNRQWLELFVDEAGDKVREAMEPFGYYGPKVTASLNKSGDREYRVLVEIEPGVPVRVSSITVLVRGRGAEEQALVEMASSFSLKKGDVLLHAEYEKGKELLRLKAQELGYLDAEFPVHEIRVTKAESSAVVNLELDTGVRYRFGETTFTGAPQYPRSFLQRYLDYAAGEVFSQEKLGQTQANLTSSDRFKGVVATADREKAHDSVMPVNIELSPLPRRRLRPGIGYGTDTGFRGSVKYRDVNMFLLGHELNSEINISQRLQGIAFGYQIPGSRDINSVTSFQLNAQREETDSYTDLLISAEGAWSRSFLRGQVLTLSVKAQHDDFTVGTQHARTFLLVPGARFTDRRFDNLIRPTSGYSYSLEVRGTHQALGSSTGLLQFIAEGHAILPLGWRFSLNGRVKGGLTVQNEPLKDLPPSLRFFAGGDRSVRGYGYQSLGPKDIFGDVIGGKHLLTASVELERALFTDWGVAAFYDIGNAFNTLDSIRLYQGAGVGARYYTSIGAIQLDVAQQIGGKKPVYRVHFTVGFEL